MILLSYLVLLECCEQVGGLTPLPQSHISISRVPIFIMYKAHTNSCFSNFSEKMSFDSLLNHGRKNINSNTENWFKPEFGVVIFSC